MLFSELKKKEVISLKDCRKLGHVVDLEFDECGGCIRGITVSNHLQFCNCFPFFTIDSDLRISYKNICQMGPDIIVVDL